MNLMSQWMWAMDRNRSSDGIQWIPSSPWQVKLYIPIRFSLRKLEAWGYTMLLEWRSVFTPKGPR